MATDMGQALFSDIIYIIEECQNHGIRNFDEAAHHLGFPQDSIASTFVLAIKSFHKHRHRYYFVTDAGDIGWAPFGVNAGQPLCYFAGGKILHVLSEDCTEHIACA